MTYIINNIITIKYIAITILYIFLILSELVKIKSYISILKSNIIRKGKVVSEIFFIELLSELTNNFFTKKLTANNPIFNKSNIYDIPFLFFTLNNSCTTEIITKNVKAKYAIDLKLSSIIQTPYYFIQKSFTSSPITLSPPDIKQPTIKPFAPPIL